MPPPNSQLRIKIRARVGKVSEANNWKAWIPKPTHSVVVKLCHAQISEQVSSVMRLLSRSKVRLRTPFKCCIIITPSRKLTTAKVAWLRPLISKRTSRKASSTSKSKGKRLVKRPRQKVRLTTNSLPLYLCQAAVLSPLLSPLCCNRWKLSIILYRWPTRIRVYPLKISSIDDTLKLDNLIKSMLAKSPPTSFNWNTIGFRIREILLPLLVLQFQTWKPI